MYIQGHKDWIQWDGFFFFSKDYTDFQDLQNSQREKRGEKHKMKPKSPAALICWGGVSRSCPASCPIWLLKGLWGEGTCSVWTSWCGVTGVKPWQLEGLLFKWIIRDEWISDVLGTIPKHDRWQRKSHETILPNTVKLKNTLIIP